MTDHASQMHRLACAAGLKLRTVIYGLISSACTRRRVRDVWVVAAAAVPALAAAVVQVARRNIRLFWGSSTTRTSDHRRRGSVRQGAGTGIMANSGGEGGWLGATSKKRQPQRPIDQAQA